MKFLNTQLLYQADATQTSQTSSAIDASYMVTASVTGVAAGATITGTLKVQASNDLTNPTNWVDAANGVFGFDAIVQVSGWNG